MKKITYLILTSAAVFAASSCRKEAEPAGALLIDAVSEGIGASVKTDMAYKYDVLWSENDRICVTDGTSSDTFTLTSGQGTVCGTFKQDGAVKLSGEVEAFYPSSLSDHVWPAVQENTQNVPMYCKKTLSGEQTEEMHFSSLGAILQIVFTTPSANVTLKSIVIADGKKTLSGAFTVDESGKAVITATDGAGITADLGKGVAVGVGAKYFNFAVPAGDYDDLGIVLTSTDGRQCELKSNTVNSLAHNSVCRLTLSGEFKGITVKGTTLQKETQLVPGRESKNVEVEMYYARVDFVKGETVSVIGLEDDELNRDFFEIQKDGSVKFAGPSGNYRISYYPDYRYTWLVNADMAYPDCIYILGNGYWSAPVYDTRASWNLAAYTRDTPIVAVAPKIADGTYQATVSMSTDNANWRVLLEFYSDLSWGQTGVSPVGITGSAADRFYLDGTYLRGVDEKGNPFQPGNYRLTMSAVTGGISIDITKLD